MHLARDPMNLALTLTLDAVTRLPLQRARASLYARGLMRLVLGLALVVLTACSGTERRAERPPEPARVTPVSEPIAITEAPEPEPPPIPEDSEAPEGPACTTTADCRGGLACRGPRGCTSEWACGEPRACDEADRVAYCACDGFTTFYAPAGCPGRPYASVGPCGEVGVALGEGEMGIPAGDEPLTSEDRLCESSEECGRGRACYGQGGCGVAWSCQRVRGCGRAQATFCGCDGTTFTASSRCPGRPFAHRGACRGDEAVASTGGMDAGVARSSSPRESRDAGAAIASSRAPRDAGVDARAAIAASSVDAGASEVPRSPDACRTSRDCRGMRVCMGPPGCGFEWTCQRPPERCNPDTQVFCDCEGNTFRASMNCPGQPYAHRGSCDIDRLMDLSGAIVR